MLIIYYVVMWETQVKKTKNYYFGLVNSTRKIGDDLGMDYYWVYLITVIIITIIIITMIIFSLLFSSIQSYCHLVTWLAANYLHLVWGFSR